MGPWELLQLSIFVLHAFYRQAIWPAHLCSKKVIILFLHFKHQSILLQEYKGRASAQHHPFTWQI